MPGPRSAAQKQKRHRQAVPFLKLLVIVAAVICVLGICAVAAVICVLGVCAVAAVCAVGRVRAVVGIICIVLGFVLGIHILSHFKLPPKNEELFVALLLCREFIILYRAPICHI